MNTQLTLTCLRAIHDFKRGPRLCETIHETQAYAPSYFSLSRSVQNWDDSRETFQTDQNSFTLGGAQVPEL